MCWRSDTRQDERALRRIREEIVAHVHHVAAAKEDIDAFQCVVGELLGNVHRYAPGPFCAELHWKRDEAHLTVHDSGPCFSADDTDVPSLANPEAEHGRGLAIIRAAGGRVQAHIAGDTGCRVTVMLPVVRVAYKHPPLPPCPYDHPASRGEHCPRISRPVASGGRSSAS